MLTSAFRPSNRKTTALFWGRSRKKARVFSSIWSKTHSILGRFVPSCFRWASSNQRGMQVNSILQTKRTWIRAISRPSSSWSTRKLISILKSRKVSWWKTNFWGWCCCRRRPSSPGALRGSRARRILSLSEFSRGSKGSQSCLSMI